uniref:Uncharacterized protein n=1 Tax=Anguilla anguilla TaxID=7936 RepID=A0A0E9Q1B8_ANGAN
MILWLFESLQLKHFMVPLIKYVYTTMNQIAFEYNIMEMSIGTLRLYSINISFLFFCLLNCLLCAPSLIFNDIQPIKLSALKWML